MKCPECGKEMYSSVSAGSDTARGNYIDTKYICPRCGFDLNVVRYYHRQHKSVHIVRHIK